MFRVFEGDIGGLMGLFLGGSAISLFEILDLFMCEILIKLASKRRYRSPPKKSWVANAKIPNLSSLKKDLNEDTEKIGDPEEINGPEEVGDPGDVYDPQPSTSGFQNEDLFVEDVNRKSFNLDDEKASVDVPFDQHVVSESPSSRVVLVKSSSDA